jgi:hypothetical protein
MFANLPGIVHVALILIVIGVVLSLINRYVPMAGSIKSILNAVVVISVLVWLLSVFGFLGSISTFPKIRNPLPIRVFLRRISKAALAGLGVTLWPLPPRGMAVKD